MPMKTPFELEIVNDNDDNDNGDKVCDYRMKCFVKRCVKCVWL